MHKFLESIIYEIYNILKKDIGVIKNNKIIITFGEIKDTDFTEKLTEKEFNPNLQEGTIAKKYTYEKLNLNDDENYYVFVKGTSNEDLNYLKIVTSLIFKLCKSKDLKDEKEEFIRKILKKSLFYDEISVFAKECNINLNEKAIVFLIENFGYNTKELINILKKKLTKEINFILSLNYKNIVMIKTINEKFDENKFFKLINKKIEDIKKSLKIKINIGVGGVVENLRDLYKSFEESKIALEINKVFNENNKITKYNNLGIKRLIYSIPDSVCENFLKETLKNKKIENLSEEILFTINNFFKNDLNVSETSRKLFIHRNTLVYRLEKIKKITGLDLKKFEDATKFKLALIINKYLNFTKTKELNIKGETKWFSCKTFVLDMILQLTF